MSILWSAADVARATRLPQAGRILMLQCFFDDSGTHGGSQVVVWGGVIGSLEQFDRLESQWKERLREPLPDKPPLKKFHLFHCRERTGEFECYSDAESDSLQYLFRSIVIDSGVIPVAFGVSVASWNAIVPDSLKAFLGSAESASLGYCIKRAFEYAAVNLEMKMTLTFDRGRMLQIHQTLLQAAATLLPEAASRPAEVFLPVEDTPGLQAADVVANYFYRYALAWLKDPNSNPEPHFLHLVKNAPYDGDDAINEYGVFNDEAIRAMVDGMRGKRPDLWRD